MKKFIFLLILVFQFVAPNLSYSQEITEATKAAAAKAPQSKLVGTWWKNGNKFVFRANGTGTMYYLNYDGPDLYEFTQTFTYNKKGNDLVVKEGRFTAKPINKAEHESLALIHGQREATKRKKQVVDMVKLICSAGVYGMTGDILYLDGDCFAVKESETGKIYWYENESYIKKKEAQEEQERIAKEKAEAEAKIMKESWDAACSTNTIEAFESFLEKYPQSVYTQEAQNKLSTLKAEKEWTSLRSSDDLEALKDFVDTYPNYTNIKNAQSRIYALEGLKAYQQGNAEEAISKFKMVSSESDVPAIALSAYKDCKQTIDFRTLSSTSSTDKLEQYLAEYPSSPYTTEVRNYLALALANNFNPMSNQDSYSTALSYASGNTVQIVQNKIDENIAEQKALAKQAKKDERKAYGGWGGLLLEYGDFTWNGKNENGLFQYNFGIKLKVGNFNDRVQFAVGVKPGVGVWDFKGIYNEEKPGKSSAFFEMPVEAELRVNLFKLGLTSWCYLDGRFDYNAVRKKEIQAPMGFYAGIGFAGRFMDLTLFYGRQLGSISDEYSMINGLANPFKDSKNNNYFGLSLGWYIDL